MIEGIIKCSKSFKMREIELLLSLAYMYILTLWLCLMSNPDFM